MDDDDHLDKEKVHVDGDDEGDEEEGGGPEELVHLSNGNDYYVHDEGGWE